MPRTQTTTSLTAGERDRLIRARDHERALRMCMESDLDRALESITIHSNENTQLHDKIDELTAKLESCRAELAALKAETTT